MAMRETRNKFLIVTAN